MIFLRQIAKGFYHWPCHDFFSDLVRSGAREYFQIAVLSANISNRRLVVFVFLGHLKCDGSRGIYSIHITIEIELRGWEPWSHVVRAGS